MITTFSFKILHNLLSRYTSGPGPSDTASSGVLAANTKTHIAMFQKQSVHFKKIQKKLKDEMIWGKQNYNPTIETHRSRIRIVDLIAANVHTESEKLLTFQITVISLEFILIYIFAGLLTILGAVLLAVCINQYRKKGNQSTKRYVSIICLKNSSFPSF